MGSATQAYQEFQERLKDISDSTHDGGGHTVRTYKLGRLVQDRLNGEQIALLDRTRDHINSTGLARNMDVDDRRKLHALSLEIQTHVEDEAKLLLNEVRNEERRDRAAGIRVPELVGPGTRGTTKLSVE